ncbi:MAG: hypothetical protein GF421_05240 [Candidatus Aminicenantes bacterium]|nr:hypothetical protein [Candidatus Aminicenantes bacterium]
MKRGLLILSLILSLALFPSLFRAEGNSEKPNNGLLVITSASQQGEIEKTILEALDQFKKGNIHESVALLAEAMMMIKSGEKLSIDQLFLCKEINGYRDYVKREGNTIKSSEPFLLYIEPAGYQIRREGSEYKIWVSEDASIVNEKGKVIFQRNNWVEYNKGFVSPVIPFYITNRVTDIPPGKYTFKFTIKDNYKKTFLEQSYEFVVE